jgi:hypothetical protein
MRRIVWLIVFLVVLCYGGLRGELLSRIGPVDTDALQTLKGFWMIEDSKYMFEFTDRYACRIDGLKYFHYKRSNNHTSYPWVFTVVKSKKTGKWYFARGSYQKSRFYGSTSRLVFEKKGRITVYYSNNPKKVFFRAFRVSPEKLAKLKKKNKSKQKNKNRNKK